MVISINYRSGIGYGRAFRMPPDAGRRGASEYQDVVAGVKAWTSPVLFIHGDDDRNVDFSQTVDLVQKLRAKGDVHIELLVRPDEPHEFKLYRNRMDAYNATFEFLNKFIGRK